MVRISILFMQFLLADVDATRRAQADPIPDTVRCGRSVPFDEEDESPFVGLLRVEAA